MSSEWQPRPYVVGEENVYVVGVQGIVDAISSESVTIEGHVLPRVMSNGVRYMSMIWPEDSAAICDREHIDDTHPEEHPEREALTELIDAIRDRHETTHAGSLRFCDDGLCRTADSVQMGVLA